MPQIRFVGPLGRPMIILVLTRLHGSLNGHGNWMSCRKFKSLFNNYVTMHSPLGVTYCIPSYILTLFVQHVSFTLRIMNIFLHCIRLPSEHGSYPPSMGGFAKPLLRLYNMPSVMSCMSGTCDARLPCLELSCSFGVYGKVANRSSSRMLCRISCTPLFELIAVRLNGNNDIALHFFPLHC